MENAFLSLWLLLLPAIGWAGQLPGWLSVAEEVVRHIDVAEQSYLAGRLGAGRGLVERFVELGYQYAQVAMVSLVLGLGGDLFVPLTTLGLSDAVVGLLKGGFCLGLLWSLYLGRQILFNQGLCGAGYTCHQGQPERIWRG